MIPREILKKNQQIEIRTNRIVIGFICASISGVLLSGCVTTNRPSTKATSINSADAQSTRIIGNSGSLIPPEIPINDKAGRGGWLVVTLELEDGSSFPAIIDTGCPGILLDKSLQPALGKQLHPFKIWTMFGQQDSGLYATPKLYLSGTQLIAGQYVATYDFSKSSPMRKAGIKGIIGMDCLVNYCVQLDFQKGKMRFLRPEQVVITELGSSFDLKSSSNGRGSFETELLAIHHTGLLGGTNRDLIIDTGYNNDGAVDDGVIKGHYLTRLIHFFIPFRNLRIGRCVWDGEEYTNLRIGTGWNVIGLRFLARHLVTFDFPQGKLYLKKVSSGPP